MNPGHVWNILGTGKTDRSLTLEEGMYLWRKLQMSRLQYSGLGAKKGSSAAPFECFSFPSPLGLLGPSGVVNDDQNQSKSGLGWLGVVNDDQNQCGFVCQAVNWFPATRVSSVAHVIRHFPSLKAWGMSCWCPSVWDASRNHSTGQHCIPGNVNGSWSVSWGMSHVQLDQARNQLLHVILIIYWQGTEWWNQSSSFSPRRFTNRYCRW